MIVSSMYLLYKKPLETCLDCLNRLKKHLGEGQSSQSLTYAGRLDPLASGLLIALGNGDMGSSEDNGQVGQKSQVLEPVKEVKQRILDLPKTYEFEVVFGVGTDTFDQLGLICPSNEVVTWRTLNFDQELLKSQNLADLKDEMKVGEPNTRRINKLWKRFLDQTNNGKIEMYYPFFSSRTINGKQLFELTKEKGTEAVNKILPKRSVELYFVECLGSGSISAETVADESIEIAEKIEGDFRQKEIIESWKKFLGERGTESPLRVFKFRINCGSGFYVRTFACWLGQMLGEGAIARNIFRTKVGEFDVRDAITI